MTEFKQEFAYKCSTCQKGFNSDVRPFTMQCLSCTEALSLAAHKSAQEAEIKISEGTDIYNVTPAESKIEMKRAYAAARHSMLKKAFEEQMMDPDALQNLPEEMQDMLAQFVQNKAKKEKKTSEFALVTVNCKLGADDAGFIQAVHTMAQSKMIGFCRYAFEKGSNGHTHAHMLCHFRKPTANSTIRNNFWAKFKSFMGPSGKTDNHILNVTILPNETEFNKCDSYVMGDKDSDEKMQDLQTYTMPFRLQWKLCNYYHIEEGAEIVGYNN